MNLPPSLQSQRGGGFVFDYGGGLRNFAGEPNYFVYKTSNLTDFDFQMYQGQRC
jgi:hypothetical protein